MKKCRLTVTALCLSALMLFSPTVMKAENPFMAPYGTPFNMPPFDKISNSDYLPAFEEAYASTTRRLRPLSTTVPLPTSTTLSLRSTMPDSCLKM